jgi:tetratricopeptide (TPR) repeat protein
MRHALTGIVGAAGLAAAAGAEEPVSKSVIGEEFPLAAACFENAQDGAFGAKALKPCDDSLESESMSERRRAIVLANRGVIQFNSGFYDAAVADFTTSLDLGVYAASRVLVNRGLAYEALRHDELARRDYKRALELSPNNRTAKRRLEELAKPYLDRTKVPVRIEA